MDSFPVAINSLIPAKTQQASEITRRLKGKTDPLNNTTEKDCFNIGWNWTCFQPAILGVINVQLCFSSWFPLTHSRVPAAQLELESHRNSGDKVMTMHDLRSLSMICVLRDYRFLSCGFTCSNQSILTANLKVHRYCCSEAQQVLLRSVFR